MSESDLSSFSNYELLTALQLLVQKDHEGNAKVIRFLREVEERQLHLEKGCESLELFCQVVLGLTENQARTRVRAMRLTYSVPLAEEKIRAGELSLSVASLAQRKFIQAERDGEPLSAKKRCEIVDKLEHCSLSEAARVLAETLGGPAPPKEKKTAYAGGATRIEFTASATLMENIERLQELLSHKNFDGRLDLLFEHISELALEELEKKKTAKDDHAAGAKTETPWAKTENITRYIPVKTQRFVWLRDGGRCQFRDAETGRTCGSRRWVQIDHIIPFSQGGRHDATNLRLLCGAHNRFVYHRGKLCATKPREETAAAPA